MSTVDWTEDWQTDPPEGMCWACPECPSWATLPGNAGYHAQQMGHGKPVLKAIAEVRPLESVRVADLFDRSLPPGICVSVQLHLLKPKELSALVEALDRLKPGISEEAWQLARALDAEEGRRVERGEPVGYSDGQ